MCTLISLADLLRHLRGRKGFHPFLVAVRHGLRQLSYMKELGMGNDRYRLLDIENDDSRLWPAAAVRNVVPFQP